MSSVYGTRLAWRHNYATAIAQLTAAILANSYLPGFLRARIYKGPLKAICVPFLNCYSCPGAWGACPVGSFQSLAAGFSQTVSLYVVGLLTAVGALGGRVVCGWLCPFGFFRNYYTRSEQKNGSCRGLLNMLNLLY
jgi:ferredoxin-type protein NapH